MYNNSRPQFNNERFKTQECRSFKETGSCDYNEKCKFAHGEHELQKPANGGGFNQNQGGNYGGNQGGFMPQQGGYGGSRPQGICRNFQQQGECRFADNCKFSHDMTQAMGNQGGQQGGYGGNGGNRPQGVCRNFQERGECRFGETCKFSHEC